MKNDRRTAMLIGGGLAILWVVLTAISDGITYHLAPFLVAGIPAFSYLFDSPSPTAARGIAVVGGGVALALAITAALAITGNLSGPSLLPAGGAALESVVFALVGGLIASAVGVLALRGRSDA